MWTRWEAESSSLFENIDSPFARSVFARIKDDAIGEILIADIEKIKATLNDAHRIAKENAEYLSTLQEYLVVRMDAHN